MLRGGREETRCPKTKINPYWGANAMSEIRENSKIASKPKTEVFITDWKGAIQMRLILYPPEIQHNHTLNIVIGPDGAIAREEDMKIL